MTEERPISEALRQGVLDQQEGRLAVAYLGSWVTITDPMFQPKRFPIPAPAPVLPAWYQEDRPVTRVEHYPTLLPDPVPDDDIW